MKTEVLFVRAEPELVKALDKRTAAERRRRPGVTVSRADIVRELLWQAIRRDARHREQGDIDG